MLACMWTRRRTSTRSWTTSATSTSTCCTASSSSWTPTRTPSSPRRICSSMGNTRFRRQLSTGDLVVCIMKYKVTLLCLQDLSSGHKGVFGWPAGRLRLEWHELPGLHLLHAVRGGQVVHQRTEILVRQMALQYN